MARRSETPPLTTLQRFALGDWSAGIVHPPMLAEQQIDNIIDCFPEIAGLLMTEALGDGGAEWAQAHEGEDLSVFVAEVGVMPADRIRRVSELFHLVFTRASERPDSLDKRGSVMLSSYGVILLTLGRYADARDVALQAQRLDPYDRLAFFVLTHAVERQIPEPE